MNQLQNIKNKKFMKFKLINNKHKIIQFLTNYRLNRIQIIFSLKIIILNKKQI